MGVNMGQHWPKNNSQRWIMSGPNSASLTQWISLFFHFFVKPYSREVTESNLNVNS